MPKGVKPRPKAQPRAILGMRVPAGLSKEEAKVYKALTRELVIEGYVCQIDWRVVALVAKAEVSVSRMEAEASALESFVSLGSAGQATVHPIVKELRTQRGALADLYAILLMTPRSRSSAKITEQQRATAASKSDELEEFLDERNH